METQLSRKELLKACENALTRIDKLYGEMGADFPSHASRQNKYFPVKNDIGWNTGFWCGILWLAYEITNDKKYTNSAEALLNSFYLRIDNKLEIDMHDLGFVYSPSCVAAYMLTGNEKAKEYALKAAEHLFTRYHPEGHYIQAWGKVGEELRLIVDCMNNLPLLYWASEATGNEKYKNAAEAHAKTTVKYIIRADGSSFHTYFFTPDGAPKCGTTHQGANDASTWARGQAWLISGLPLSYKYVKDSAFVASFEKVTDYFLNNLPQDYIPFWDLSFCDGSSEPKDSSAAAIAACGILQMLSQLNKKTNAYKRYEIAADKIMCSLIRNYTAERDKNSNGLLLHATYSKPHGIGIDECNIWGDYYYMEALARMLNKSGAYW